MADKFIYKEPACACRESSLGQNLIAKDLFQMICGNCGDIIEKLPINYKSMEAIPETTVSRLREHVESSGILADKRSARVFAATLPNLAGAVAAAADYDVSSQWGHIFEGYPWSERALFDGGPGLYETIWKALLKGRVLFDGQVLIGSVYQESLESYSKRSGLKGKVLANKYPQNGVTTHLLGGYVLCGDMAFPIDEDVRMTIFVDGAEQFTSSIGAGAGVGLPLDESAMGFGVSVKKNKLRDLRICSLVITGEAWQTQTFFEPNSLQEVRSFLERLLVTFSGEASAMIPTEQQNSQLSERLLALKNLMQAGLIDPEEYKSAKAKLLDI